MEQNNYLEPEESNVILEDADWNPLDEPVNDKPYASAGITVTEDEMRNPISEPKFAPPPSRKPTPQGTQIKEGGSAPPKKEPFNNDFKDLSKKDTENAAEHSAKMLLQGYEWLHGIANKTIQISEKKLTRLQVDGEINLNAMIMYDFGKEMRAGDFFIQYNEQVSTMFTVSDEFKEEFVPLCTKVLAKRGIGMSDEQRLAFLVGQDIATKAILGFQIKRTQKTMIDSIKENTMAIKENTMATVNLQKEMDEINRQKQEQLQKEEEQRLKREKEISENSLKVITTKRGRPTGSYRSKK